MYVSVQWLQLPLSRCGAPARDAMSLHKYVDIVDNRQFNMGDDIEWDGVSLRTNDGTPEATAGPHTAAEALRRGARAEVGQPPQMKPRRPRFGPKRRILEIFGGGFGEQGARGRRQQHTSSCRKVF